MLLKLFLRSPKTFLFLLYFDKYMITDIQLLICANFVIFAHDFLRQGGES